MPIALTIWQDQSRAEIIPENRLQLAIGCDTLGEILLEGGSLA